MSAAQFNKKEIITCFNRAAKTYDKAALLPNEIAERLIDHLDPISLQVENILDLGPATGYSTQLLHKRFPNASLFALDIAQHMLQCCKQQTQNLKNVYYVNSDYEFLPFAPRTFDLIVANLTLTWILDVEHLLRELSLLLKPNGHILFSMFGPDTLKELRTSWTADEKTHVHLFFDMHDIGDVLQQLRFKDPVMEMEYLTLSYPDVHTLLYDLKATGFHNIAASRRKTLTGKQRFLGFINEYKKFYDTENLLPATYEIIYGQARCPNIVTEGLTDKNEVRIAITDIKKLKK